MEERTRVRPILVVMTAVAASLLTAQTVSESAAPTCCKLAAATQTASSSALPTCCKPAAATQTASSSASPTCCKPAAATQTASSSASPTCCKSSPTCCKPSPASVVGAQPPEHQLELNISEPLRKIVSYMGERLMAGSSPGFSEAEILVNTGVTAAEYATLRKDGLLEEPVLRTALYAVLGNRGIDACAIGGATNCAVLNACSIDRSLAGASGAELAKYGKEKEMDGTVYADWVASDFTLPTTGGSEVSLSDYAGRPVAVTFLAGHCSHSLSTLPMLDSLQKKYAADNLAILPIYVNSGSVEDVRSWSSILEMDLDLAVADNPALADEYESFLVPSTLLIDGAGNVTTKLVGFKEEDELDAAIRELIESGAGFSRQVASAASPALSATGSQ